MTTDPDRIWRDAFIVGCPRSGTTWLHAALSTHPSFASPPETHLFADLATLQARYASQDIGICLPTVVPERDFQQWCGSLWSSIRTNLLAARPGTTRILEKTPTHAAQMALIRSAVPGALFVHIVRDPVDVARSVLEASASWGYTWAPSSIEGACSLWNDQVGRALAASMPDDTVVVRYEDLLHSPDNWEILLDFLGIERDWELPDLSQSPEQMAVITRYQPGTDTFETAEHLPQPAGSSFHTREQGKTPQLSPYEKRYTVWACRDLMTSFGYQSTRNKLGPLDRVRTKLRPHSMKSQVRRIARALKRVRFT
jgi:hypothetical protein